MSEVKEIKSVRIVPYTLMVSSIAAVLAFIAAIILLIFAGTISAFLPTTVSGSLGGGFFVGIAAAYIIVLPVSAFVGSLAYSFLIALIYNNLVPRIGGIKLELLDLNEIKSIPVVPYALMTSAIVAIFALIIFGLIYGPILAATVASLGAIPTATSASTFGMAGAIGGLVIFLLFLIGVPIVVFIVGFIGHAIIAIIYNVLAPRIGGIKLEFAALRENLFEIKTIPVIPAALITAAIAAVIGFIIGIIALILMAIYGQALAGVIIWIAIIIGTFIGEFIMVAIVVLVYNFLQPRIGGVKLELE